LLSALCYILSIFSLQAQSASTGVQTDTLQVWGECGMCKGRIEKAALQAGATSADWNQDTKKLLVSYKGSNSTSQQIQQAVANAGHDTRDITAPAAAYEKLPSCCHYQRKDAGASKMKDGCCADMSATCKAGDSCCKDGKCAHNDKKACKDMTMCKDKACCKS